MQLASLRKRLAGALDGHSEAIEQHIAQVTAAKRFAGIERAFSTALHSQFNDIECRFEVPLKELGLKNFFPGRNSGRVDCYLPGTATALEYKAVRLPRAKSGPAYDTIQLISDHKRLLYSKTLKQGFLVIFLYGDIVAMARSAGSLYRNFHNQMFVDCSEPSLDRMLFRGPEAKELGWSQPWHKPSPPKWIAAVKRGNVGAVAISVFDE